MRSLFARFRHAAMFFAAGVVAAYFLDPDRGPQRRRAMSSALDDVRSKAVRPESGPSGVTASSPGSSGADAPATPGELGGAVAYG